MREQSEGQLRGGGAGGGGQRGGGAPWTTSCWLKGPQGDTESWRKRTRGAGGSRSRDHGGGSTPGSPWEGPTRTVASHPPDKVHRGSLSWPRTEQQGDVHGEG